MLKKQSVQCRFPVEDEVGYGLLVVQCNAAYMAEIIEQDYRFCSSSASVTACCNMFRSIVLRTISSCASIQLSSILFSTRVQFFSIAFTAVVAFPDILY